MAKRGRSAARRTKESFKRAGKKIGELNQETKSRVPSGLRIIGEEIMFDVKASRRGAGVPVDKGTLRSSGKVTGPMNDEVELAFGGASAPYALEQHENLNFHHDIGEARYLVRGIDRWKQNGVSVRRALDDLAKAVAIVAARR